MSILRYFFCLVWTAVLITLSMVVMLLSFNRKVPVWMARTMWSPGILWICGARLEVSGIDNIDRSCSYIFVSNHLSFLDIPILFRVIPVNLYFVAKEEIKKMPFVGWYMWATGMIFIDRANRDKAFQSLKRAGKLIRNGKNVIMFPEGTRSKDGHVSQFKKGPFVLASESDLPVIPIALSGPEKIVPANAWTVNPGTVKVEIGKSYQKNSSESLNDFIAGVRSEMIGLKGDLVRS